MSEMVEVDLPLVEEGDQLRVWLGEGDESRVDAVVQAVKATKKVKNGSKWKYILQLDGQEQHFKTRLQDLKWKRKKEKHRPAVTAAVAAVPRPVKRNGKAVIAFPLSALRHILAPMVGASELAFRLLCRRYGATLAYTPMMSSDQFGVDADYRRQEFQSTAQDRPVVAHFSANDPMKFLAAAKQVETQCDAIGRFHTLTVTLTILTPLTSLLFSLSLTSL
jgi:hypothetical protein